MKNITRYITLIAAAATIGHAAAQESFDAAVDTGLIQVAMMQTVPAYSYTGSISTINADEFDYYQTNSLSDALVGKLAGYSADGDIRGLSSINGSAQLVVLDGIPSPTISLDNLDPRTIESVSILKDAAAKALYGPLGAQGVILVNTKKGHNGPTTVKVNANFGWQEPTVKAKLVDAYGYATLRNQALVNDGLAPAFTNEQIENYRLGLGENNDWRNLYMKKTRPQQLYNINVAGGNQRTKFFVNAGYSHTGSIYRGDFFDKYNPEQNSNCFDLSSNIQVQVFPFLKMFTGTIARISQDNASRGNNIVNRLFYTPPTVTNQLTPDGGQIVDPVLGKSIYGEINLTGVSKQTNTNINAHFGLDLDLNFITKGLSANAVVAYNSYYSGVRSGSYDYTRWVPQGDDFVRLGTNTDDPLRWGKSSSTTYFMNFQATLKYERTFAEKHMVDAFVNYLAEDRLGKSTQAAWLLPFTRIQLGGHAKYGYDNRYFAQFDFTYAGNEQMREGNQFHFSPTGSVAWVVSNEDFLKDATWLNLLKLRASYGMLNYDTLWNLTSRYLYATEYRDAGGGGIQYIYTYAGIGEGVIGNPDIRWEKSYQQDYGFDLSLFGNSLTLNFDYWRTNQREMLLQNHTVPVISGIDPSHQPFENIGKAFAEGVDFQIGYNKRFTNDISLSVAGDFGWNHNRVEYGAEIDYSALGYAYPFRTTGYPIGQQFGYLVDYSNGNGFYNSAAELANAGVRYTGTQPRVGDLRYRDLNNDGIIDNADKAPLDGVTSTPSFNYGLSLRATWNRFDLYLFFQGEAGRYLEYQNSLGVNESLQQGVFTENNLNAWTAERYEAGLPIDYPALTSSSSSSLQANDFFVSKADYLRLKNITLGYTLPDNWMRKIRFNSARIYFTAQNVFTATNLRYKGIDPQSTSMAALKYRSYNFGLNLSF